MAWAVSASGVPARRAMSGTSQAEAYLLRRYHVLDDAFAHTSDELFADLTVAQRLTAAGRRQGRIGVIEGWIGQALRARTPGLNGPPDARPAAPGRYDRTATI